MDIIEALSNKIGIKIAGALALDEDNKEILIYGAFSIIHTVWSVILIVLIGSLFDLLLEMLIISFTASLLRKYSGGAHATSSNRCAIIGTIIFLSLSIGVKVLNTDLNVMLLFLYCTFSFILTYYIMYKYCPVDTPNKPITRPETRQRLKKASLKVIHSLLGLTSILYISNLFLKSDNLFSIILSICVGLTWQAMTLIAIGNFVISKLDYYLKLTTK